MENSDDIITMSREEEWWSGYKFHEKPTTWSMVCRVYLTKYKKTGSDELYHIWVSTCVELINFCFSSTIFFLLFCFLLSYSSCLLNMYSVVVLQAKNILLSISSLDDDNEFISLFSLFSPL